MEGRARWWEEESGAYLCPIVQFSAREVAGENSWLRKSTIQVSVKLPGASKALNGMNGPSPARPVITRSPLE